MEQNHLELDVPSKEELKEIMKNPGKIKGAGFWGDREYVLEKKGEGGLRRVEEETKRLGYPIKYREIKETEWYPVGLKMVSLSAILNTFNWGEKELGEIAVASTKVSFIVRLFMKHFISIEMVFRMGGQRMWKRYFTVGEMEAIDFKDERERGWFTIRVKNFKLHPIYCFYLGHFLVGIITLTQPHLNFKEITVEETKCMFRGDPYHEYLVKWIYK